MDNTKKILTTTELSDKQTNDVLKLLELCQETYDSEEVCFMEGEMNCLEDIPCYYLAYDGEILACFLSVFIPDESSAEIYSLTTPGYENSGIFEHLINAAADTLEEADIHDIFFVSDHDDKINSDYMKKYYQEIDSSTLLMELDVPYPDVFSDVSADSSSDYIFEHKAEVTETEDEQSINHSLSFFKEGVSYGFAECEQYPHAFCLHHIEVEEKFRGKGYGKAMLSDLLTYCLSLVYDAPEDDRPIHFILNVDADNTPACKLYSGYGFTIGQQIDYYYI